MSVPRGRPPESAVAIEGEVPFHDVDPLHIVWHGHYYKYLEVARTVLLRRHRIDGPDLIPLGYRFVVAHAECRYAHPLRYGERYRVRAWFRDTEQRIDIAYEVTNLTAERRAARARTTLVTTDAEGVLLFETPAVLRARIAGGPAPSEGA
ncbi:MAG: acyl-CoA thioesterase [Sandaracinaceae bacterium]